MTSRRSRPTPRPSLAALTTVLAVLGCACSFTTFDDLQDQAPAARVEQEGSIESGAFGRPFTGVVRPNKDPGGVLHVAGTSTSPALNTVTFDGSGEFTHAQSTRDDYESGDKGLGLDGFMPRAMVAAPPDAPAVGSRDGPFVYLGAVASSGSGTLVVADIVKFRAALQLTKHDVPEFANALAAARFDASTDRFEVVAGATDRVFLIDVQWTGNDLSTNEVEHAVGKQGVVSAVAAGDLDPTTDEDEVVVAVPSKNHVEVVYNISSQFGGSGDIKSFTLELPDSAEGFGSALLIGDLDDDGKAELAVGAPISMGRAGRVFIYNLEEADFQAESDIPKDRAQPIEAPAGASEFGTAMALGAFDGGTKPLLAVSAPITTVGTVANAGRIFVYGIGSNLFQEPKGVVELKTPKEGDLLGSVLDILPFRVGSDDYQLLAASAKNAAMVFFSSLTEAHKDVRSR